jgi:trehalose-phosphatase
MNKTLSICNADQLLERLAAEDKLWLFLDYDGTLAEFAPTPDHVLPDEAVLKLVTGLAARPATRVAIISGRRLGHIQTLAPVPGVLLAGTYGVELQLPDGRRVDRVPWDSIRPTLKAVLPGWAALIGQQPGFYLEDKGWALALHGRFAGDGQAEQILTEARRLAEACIAQAPDGRFRLLGGHKFLEIGPAQANKGLTLRYLLLEHAWPGSLPVYVGDDDKDEEAFAVIKEQGGVAVVVAAQPRASHADCRLASPQAVRALLSRLAASSAHRHATSPGRCQLSLAAGANF